MLLLRVAVKRALRGWRGAVAVLAGVAAIVSLLAAVGVFAPAAFNPTVVGARAAAEQLTTFRVSMSRTTSGMPQDALAAEGTVDAPSGRSVIRYTDSFTGSLFEVYAQPSLLYMRTESPERTPWTLVTPKELSKRDPESGLLITSFSFMFLTGWTSDLAVMLRNLNSVMNLGRETLFGNATEHFRATVNILEAARQANVMPLRSEALSALMLSTAYADEIGSRDLPIDLWLDGQNRIIRIAFAVRQAHGMVSVSHRLVFSYDLSDYGVAFVPPAPSALAGRG